MSRAAVDREQIVGDCAAIEQRSIQADRSDCNSRCQMLRRYLNAVCQIVKDLGSRPRTQFQIGARRAGNRIGSGTMPGATTIS